MIFLFVIWPPQWPSNHVVESITRNLCQYNLCVYDARCVDNSSMNETHFSERSKDWGHVWWPKAATTHVALEKCLFSQSRGLIDLVCIHEKGVAISFNVTRKRRTCWLCHAAGPHDDIHTRIPVNVFLGGYFPRLGDGFFYRIQWYRSKHNMLCWRHKIKVLQHVKIDR